MTVLPMQDIKLVLQQKLIVAFSYSKLFFAKSGRVKPGYAWRAAFSTTSFSSRENGWAVGFAPAIPFA